MSNALFPVTSLKGLMWDVKKTPTFNNIIQTSASLKNEVRVAVTQYPQYKFECSFEFLRQDPTRSLAERDIVEAFFNTRQGNWDSFFIKLSDFTQDPNDSTVTGAPAGTGDGTTKAFQLYHTVNGYQEPVDGVDTPAFKVYKNGVLQSSGYIVTDGVVTFTVAPANGVVITWDGTFYYRVRFVENQYEFNLFQYRLWELQSLTFLQVNNAAVGMSTLENIVLSGGVYDCGSNYINAAGYQINGVPVTLATDFASITGHLAMSQIPTGGDNTKFLRGDGVWVTPTTSVGSVAWGAITGTLSSQTDLNTALAAKAPTASPAFTGTPTAPTPTAADNSTKIATTAFVKAQGYLTSAPVTSVAGKTGIVALTATDVSGLATVATSGSYLDLSNKPTIPAAQVNSDWNAVSGVAQILNKPTLATVATTGNYSDLSGKPTIPAAQVNSDWNAVSGVAQILNKPTLATVATSGAYTDLSGKPTLATTKTAVAGQPLLSYDATTGTFTQGALTAAQVGALPSTTVLPANTTSTANQFFTAYNNTTGAFTKAQPSFSNLSGTLAMGQIPAGGSSSTYLRGDGSWAPPSGGGGTWGSITGTLSSQTDLQTALNAKANTSSLATVATSGAYSDLSGKPSLATVATSGAYTDLTGRPSLATVATSGSYTDLSNKPTNMPTANQVISTVTGTNSIELVRGNMADNDQFRILVGGTASNAGFVEIATADDGTEPIYVRQYTGVFTSIARTATLLDGSGNTSFPGTVDAAGYTVGGSQINFHDLAGTAAAAQLPARTGAIMYTIDGGGLVPTTGVKGQLTVPTGCTITGWYLTGDQTGSASIAVNTGSYSSFPTVSTIFSATLSSAQKNSATGLSYALNANDQVQFSLSSVSACTRLNLTLVVSIPWA